jgi:hypothetical protein
VPASASGVGLGKVSPNAAKRWIVRTIAVAALLVAALAAAPARADDTVGMVPSATTVGSSPASYGDTTAPSDISESTSTAPQTNTATNTQTATATGGAGGSATGGNAGPSQVADDGSQGGSYGGDAYANGGRAESHNSLGNKQSNQISGRDSSSGNGRYVSDGQDTFALESTKGRGSDRAAARTKRARSRGHSESGTAGRVIRRESIGRGGHETGKAPPLDDGLPGHGGQLPSQNPFFSLLSGSGGAGTGLLLLLLAVLSALIALPNHRFKAFRAFTAPWRPSAYVSPIELPG